MRGSFIQSLAQVYMMHSEPTAVRTLMWHHLGQNSSLFGCLNGEIYNTNHQLVPSPMVSSQTLTPWPNSKQSLYFSASTSLLAWQAGISAFWVPQKERPNIFVYGEKFRAEKAEKGRWKKHTWHTSWITACLVKQSLAALRQQVETCFAFRRVWDFH